MLSDYLGFQRSTLLHICAGLTGEQLARRAAPPSTLSLLGLIRHLAKVERIWFRERFGRQPVERLFGFEHGRDADFERTAPALAEQAHAQLLDEWALADAAAAGAALADTFEHHGDPFSLRMVYLHMIGEYARHNGHADMIRERIDGVTAD